MASELSGSKTAQVIASVLFGLVLVAIIFLVGGDSVTWSLQSFVGAFSRSTQNTFLPTIWEYKVHILVFGAVIAAIFLVRKMSEGPVKKH